MGISSPSFVVDDVVSFMVGVFDAIIPPSRSSCRVKEGRRFESCSVAFSFVSIAFEIEIEIDDDDDEGRTPVRGVDPPPPPPPLGGRRGGGALDDGPPCNNDEDVADA